MPQTGVLSERLVPLPDTAGTPKCSAPGRIGYSTAASSFFSGAGRGGDHRPTVGSASIYTADKAGRQGNARVCPRGRALSTHHCNPACRNAPYRELICNDYSSPPERKARCSGRSARNQWRFAPFCSGAFAALSRRRRGTPRGSYVRLLQIPCKSSKRSTPTARVGGHAATSAPVFSLHFQAEQHRPRKDHPRRMRSAAFCSICCFSSAGILEFQSLAPDLFRLHPRGRVPAPTLSKDPRKLEIGESRVTGSSIRFPLRATTSF
jgi:hypothetical protein